MFEINAFCQWLHDNYPNEAPCMATSLKHMQDTFLRKILEVFLERICVENSDDALTDAFIVLHSAGMRSTMERKDGLTQLVAAARKHRQVPKLEEVVRILEQSHYDIAVELRDAL